MTGTIPNLGRDKVSLGVTPTLWWNDDFPLIDIGIPFEQCVSEMALVMTSAPPSRSRAARARRTRARSRMNAMDSRRTIRS
ncbi:hypothetical protein BM536_000800 [Streptomyces phaeoluteigriseus]|uniref:Uncharacterized protein n=1 Tax=Streptomyces phaeoluteigriseus TaxID=114686 RepID=A0A1V6MZ42_9ACTN|nr:hypothetical protein [Streptomyces phaeoluteigriseus]OQD57674.1 hypothetical protein BM536_000800 [Streptomyces phaeoluteigriseus]